MEFTLSGVAATLGLEYASQLQVIFLLLIAGLGVKAALVPLHGWLPQAMIAPAPVSALLHAVAAVKAGALDIIRESYTKLHEQEIAQTLNLHMASLTTGRFNHHHLGVVPARFGRTTSNAVWLIPLSARCPWRLISGSYLVWPGGYYWLCLAPCPSRHHEDYAVFPCRKLCRNAGHS